MTTTNLVFIDNYFKGRLSALETTHFEQQILTDQDFAEEVLLYCGTMELAKEKMVEEKKERFRKLYKGNAPTRSLRRWWPYVAAAAAVVGIIFAILGFFRSSSSLQEKAERYITQQLSVVSVQMNNANDSLQVAKQWFNESKLAESGELLDRILQNGDQRDEARRLAGIVSLRLGDYDKAIIHFTALEKISLFANPGKFHHALTLIKRNHEEDLEMAKTLLKQVVDENLEGKETAADWLKNL